jgi:NAD(P)H-hydrate epimerase
MSSFPEVSAERVAWISEADMIEVDRVMIDDLHIELLQMMENAGRNLARLVLDLGGRCSVAIVAGSGGNGGGGLVAARHLANAGVDVTVTTTRPASELTGAAAHQLDILRRMGVEVHDEIGDAAVIVDAVIGYSLRGAPGGRTRDLIEAINVRDATVVSLDVPSGLDASTGEKPGMVVEADATLTLALPKIGMRHATSVGDLFLADISVPRSVTAVFGSPPPDFALSPILGIVN